MKEIIEEWRPIKGFEGLYEVSNLGRVRTVSHIVVGKNGTILTIPSRIKKPYIINTGYESVDLYKNSVCTKRTVHYLVAQAFLPNEKDKTQIDHINTIRTDNRVENLRYCTARENSNNPLTREHMSNGKKGKRNPKKWKPFIQYDSEDMYPIAEWDNVKQCADFTGIKASNIRSCLCGVQEKSWGFIFKHKREVV